MSVHGIPGRSPKLGFLLGGIEKSGQSILDFGACCGMAYFRRCPPSNTIAQAKPFHLLLLRVSA